MQRAFGKNKKGEKAVLYTLKNKNGMTFEVTDLGATLVSLQVPDKNGILCDVVLGCEDAAAYENAGGTFFGATVGRNANRIGGAEFSLNGKTYMLDKNNGENNLHSGLDFYSFRIWKVKETAEKSITFSLYSPDGDQGYPGALDVDVTYTLTEENEVRIDYAGVSDQDTIINLTNHSYFNLNGHASGPITGHELWIDADVFTRTDAVSIPTGELVPVEGTPMDFRTPKVVGKEIDAEYEAVILGNGYDHNWCLKNNGKLQKVAEAKGEKSGIIMDVYTDLPGMQVYTANFMEREPGKEGAVYGRRQGICFETQYAPDAIHHAHFESPVCRAGQVYRTTTIYKFR